MSKNINKVIYEILYITPVQPPLLKYRKIQNAVVFRNETFCNFVVWDVERGSDKWKDGVTQFEKQTSAKPDKWTNSSLRLGSSVKALARLLPSLAGVFSRSNP